MPLTNILVSLTENDLIRILEYIPRGTASDLYELFREAQLSLHDTNTLLADPGMIEVLGRLKDSLKVSETVSVEDLVESILNHTV